MFLLQHHNQNLFDFNLFTYYFTDISIFQIEMSEPLQVMGYSFISLFLCIARCASGN